jgi:hypothetical protein
VPAPLIYPVSFHCVVLLSTQLWLIAAAAIGMGVGTTQAMAAAEWERYRQCVARPDPRVDAQVNSYLLTAAAQPLQATQLMGELHGALALCHDNELLAAEVQRLVWGTVGAEEPMAALNHVVSVRQLSQQRMDAVTAHLLQHADELQNAKGEVVICAQSPTDTDTHHPECTAAKLGLWVNLAKNPRFKTIQIPQLGFTAELPKPLALASIAVR